MPHHLDQHKLIGRLHRIRGQVDAVERLLKSDQDCRQLLQQIAAVRGAVDGLMADVVEHHIREHLVVPELLDAERAHDVEQLVTVLRSYLKK
jgi:DNA-binding FrmR family transcriptional regulator